MEGFDPFEQGRVFVYENKEVIYPVTLTKREQFAMAAMQGFCANGTECAMLNEMMIEVDEHRSLIVKASVAMADILLKELAK